MYVSRKLRFIWNVVLRTTGEHEKAMIRATAGRKPEELSGPETEAVP